MSFSIMEAIKEYRFSQVFEAILIESLTVQKPKIKNKKDLEKFIKKIKEEKRSI